MPLCSILLASVLFILFLSTLPQWEHITGKRRNPQWSPMPSVVLAVMTAVTFAFALSGILGWF